jgi:hypothetical protein
MFDENIPRSAEPPKNLPLDNEPQDIFSEVEKKSPPPKVGEENSALTAGVLRAKTPYKPYSVLPDDKENPRVETNDEPTANVYPAGKYKMREPILGKIIVVIFVILIILGLAYGGWKFYLDYTADAEIDPSPSNQEIAPEVTEETPLDNSAEPLAETEETEEAETFLPNNVELDFDKDGLSDDEEDILLTDPQLADTDGDGLSDGDEVNVWQTDPRDPDTDGDGYWDGEEIENEYNPLGPGKLFTKPEEVSTPSSSVF